MKLHKTILFLPFAFCFFRLLPGKTAELIGDGVVLQRDANVRIWGWASVGEKIAIQFIGSTYHVTANKDGEWEVMLSNLKASEVY
jgi:sialate O-acetylesterase